jgi:hypothetical protein
MTQQHHELTAKNILDLGMATHNNAASLFNIAQSVGNMVLQRGGELSTEFHVTMKHLYEAVNGRLAQGQFKLDVLQGPYCLPLIDFAQMVANLYLLLRQSAHMECVIANVTAPVESRPPDLVDQGTNECAAPDLSRLKPSIEEQADVIAQVVAETRIENAAIPCNVVSLADWRKKVG